MLTAAKKMSSKWILTDPDDHQYVRKESPYVFTLIEVALSGFETDRWGNKKGVYVAYIDTIDVLYYIHNEPDELSDILFTYGYDGVDDLTAHYGSEGPQVAAECIFEYYGHDSATIIHRGVEVIFRI